MCRSEALNPEADPSTETAASEDSVAAAGAGEEARSKLLQAISTQTLAHSQSESLLWFV